MHYKNVAFLMAGFVCAYGFIACANAVPTVRRLGVGNSYSPNVATSAVSSRATNNANTSRISTIRSNTANIKPVSTNKSSQNIVKKSVETTDDSRLSVGKYIHNSGVASGLIKPINSNTSAVVQSDEIINLTDRVMQLEAQVVEKQDNLFPGRGIEIENNVISVSDEMQQLPDRVEDLSNQLDEKVDVANMSSNYYTKSETQQIVSETVQNVVNETVIQNNDTIYDVADGERKYVSVVDQFDPNVLE